MSKPLIWWYAFGEYKKLSRSANSTLSSTEWGQDIKTTQNKTSKRLFGTKINSKNCNPLAFQNNSTTFASEYISHLLFIISTSPSISAKIGGFSFTPETFPRKNFWKIFYINQSFGADFFLYFRCEKLCFLGANFFLLFWREKLWG